MHIDISSGSSSGWQAGYGHGGYEHCGWFLTAEHSLVREGIFDHNCGTTRYNENHFAQKINITPSNDGTVVPILMNCTRYLNVKPWATGATTGSTSVGTLLVTDTFRWRYRTRNQQWVLGRMTRPNTDVYYDWMFVPNSCVAPPPITNLRDPSSSS
jgi:hypothetical protein